MNILDLFSIDTAHYPDRMGKTIQIIALLVTDGKKPNLVIAYVGLFIVVQSHRLSHSPDPLLQ